MKKQQQSFKPRQVSVSPVSPAELRKQVINYNGKVGPIGSKLQAAVWGR